MEIEYISMTEFFVFVFTIQIMNNNKKKRFIIQHKVPCI